LQNHRNKSGLSADDQQIIEQMLNLREQLAYAASAGDMEKLENAMKRENWREALGYVTRVLAIMPYHEVALLYQAQALLRLGRKRDALTTAQSAILFTKNAQIKQYLQQIIDVADQPEWIEDVERDIQSKNWYAARRVLDHEISRNDTSIEARYYRALSYFLEAQELISNRPGGLYPNDIDDIEGWLLQSTSDLAPIWKSPARMQNEIKQLLEAVANLSGQINKLKGSR